MAGEGEVEVAAKRAKEKKPRATKGPKEKNAKASALSHPPYFEMIKEAIMALHEKTGSSSYAIAKYVEEKHKGELPPNFKKMLAIQLRSFAGKGKLVRIKASFKLAEAGKKETKPAASPKEKKKPREAGTKRKAPSNAAAAPKKKAVAAKRTPKSPAAAPKKKAVAAKRTPRSPAAKAKKAGVAAKAKKAAPVKPRQPKSIKSPAAKRARKTTAA